MADYKVLMPSKRPTRQLTQLFEHSPVPMYVLDETREILYCNRALSQWLGVDASDLIGRVCNYQSEEVGEGIAAAVAALCPPPTVFEGEQVTASVCWNNSRGETESRSATFLPLGGGNEGQSVLAVLSDVKPSAQPPALIEDVDAQASHERIQQLVRQARGRFRLDRLVGDSPAMRRVRNQVRAAIASPARVVIYGPVGSGREHVARTIHYADARDHAGPIHPLECSSLDAEVLQTSVFGFLRRCQEASGKTPPSLLLLNADSLNEAAQNELLAFLRVPTFSVRTIATTRKPLTELARDGKFLAELALELSTVVIELPPLAQRRQDIPMLAQRFVEEFNVAGAKQLAGFSPTALDRLASLPWTGNVEELAGVVRDACRTVGTVWIGEADLPERVQMVESAGARPRRQVEAIRLDEFLIQVERELIERAMTRMRGNKAKAARLLGISRTRLLRRLSQLGLAPPVETQIDFKPVDDTAETAGS